MPAAAFVTSEVAGESDDDKCRDSYSCNCDEFGCDTCYRYRSGDIEGTISSGSSNVYINGKRAAYVGSSTSESVDCPSGYSTVGSRTGTGSVTSGSARVFINGRAAARVNDSVNHFSGNGRITTGSSNVYIN